MTRSPHCSLMHHCRTVSDDEIILMNQSRKLYAAWTEFCKNLPENQRQEMTDEIPSIKYLFKTVDEASKSWNDKSESKTTGKLSKVFRNLCRNFQDHSTLLSMVPKDDKYICLLTGALAAIAQVS